MEPVRLSPMKKTQPSGTWKLALDWVMPCHHVGLQIHRVASAALV